MTPENGPALDGCLLEIAEMAMAFYVHLAEETCPDLAKNGHANGETGDHRQVLLSDHLRRLTC